MELKTMALSFLFVCFYSELSAQVVAIEQEQCVHKEILGKVTDENGNPLVGVSIMIKGTQREQ